VEIEGEDLVFENVGFTGEILNVASLAATPTATPIPIDMEMAVRLALAADLRPQGDTKTYDDVRRRDAHRPRGDPPSRNIRSPSRSSRARTGWR
jgi:hypothetical protein